MTFKASEASPSDQSYLENDRPSNLTSRYVQPAEVQTTAYIRRKRGAVNTFHRLILRKK